MKHIITVQSRAESTDAYGGLIYTWSDFAKVWAEVDPLKGRELIAAQAAQSEITVRFVVRFVDGIDSTMRILHEGAAYNIMAPPINTGGMNRELVILAKAAG